MLTLVWKQIEGATKRFGHISIGLASFKFESKGDGVPKRMERSFLELNLTQTQSIQIS